MQHKRRLSVKLNGKILNVDFGIPIYEILDKSPHKGRFVPLGAIINNRVDGLHYRLKSDATVTTFDITRREGMDIYRRTASILLCAAMHDINPKASIIVGQSVSDNYFFEVKKHKISDKLLKNLEIKIKELIKAKISLTPEWTVVEEAIQFFKQQKQESKVLLLEQNRRSEVPLVKVGNYYSIAFGPVAHCTSTIKDFKLKKYRHGLLLIFPNAKGVVLNKIEPQPKLFDTYIETKKWHEFIGASNITQLNEHCIKGTISELIKVAEALHEKKISSIADEIAKRKKVKLVLIAGPSSSGKTTFAKRLAIQLKLHGLDPVSISLDNYYVKREKTPKHPDGSYDFECLEALDLKLLDNHLRQLMKGKEVFIPKYNFQIGGRDPVRKRRLKLDKNQILLIEGIHGLNDRLTPSIKRREKFKVYVSALTQLSIDDHNRIFTTDTRLIRRIVRDRLYRGSNAAESLRIWQSVRLGEAKYIFPYQEDADIMFNSALSYEPALLKTFAERFLMEVKRDDPSFMEATRLLRFFDLIVPILPVEVPHTSILREFIGGSAFRY